MAPLDPTPQERRLLEALERMETLTVQEILRDPDFMAMVEGTDIETLRQLIEKLREEQVQVRAENAKLKKRNIFLEELVRRPRGEEDERSES
jgi:DNA-binding MarR family transcriptional regulator